MDNLDDVFELFSTQEKGNTSNNKKRKWREIEQLKDKFQLERELRIYEDSLEYMLEEF
jgi:hypothetical protein